MKDNITGPFAVDAEKLHVLIVTDDSESVVLLGAAVSAYFRAFIVQDRATGKVALKYRFKKLDGKRTWYVFVNENPDVEIAVNQFVDIVREMLVDGAKTFAIPMQVEVYRVPEDIREHADSRKVMEWLLEKDLVTIKLRNGQKPAQA